MLILTRPTNWEVNLLQWIGVTLVFVSLGFDLYKGSVTEVITKFYLGNSFICARCKLNMFSFCCILNLEKDLVFQNQTCNQF